MMSMEKLGELVSRLQKRTDEGKLRWEQTSTKGLFLAGLSDFSVQIGKLADESDEDEGSFEITVFNKDGDDVECFSDADLSTVTPAEEDKTYSNLMRTLYAAARRKALGAEEAIDSLLEILDDEDEEK